MFHAEGFSFDMGPSWYWMPDVFETFFNEFGRSVSDYYKLLRLDPSYTVYWQDGSHSDIPADFSEYRQMVDRLEPGAGAALDKFLKEAAYKYEVGINKLVYKPGRSLFEFADLRFLSGIFRLQVFSSIAAHVRKHFSNPKLVQLMEFPILFLGALPADTPALYSLMNYADIKLGTWYPEGGMHEIARAMHQLAEEQGVDFRFEENVTGFRIENNRIKAVKTEHGEVPADVVIGGADYHHIEQQLLPAEYRHYSPAYWQKRTMAPSSLLYYLGLDTRVPELHHHTLFFDTPFQQHAQEIYTDPKWPSEPLFYACCPSRTDAGVAAEGHENLFLLIPTAVDLDDTEEVRSRYLATLLERLRHRIGRDLEPHLVYQRSFAHRDFKSEYNSFRGNAYGLANTLFQTALFKPRLKAKKVKNLYFTGQLTVPGPGVPPSLISGRVVATEVAKAYRLNPATQMHHTKTKSPAAAI